ncbi:hypothetical protein [Chromobacterium violaceum]|nr:hypothetical protein [Chromobacterium violaceum]
MMELGGIKLGEEKETNEKQLMKEERCRASGKARRAISNKF